MKDYIRRMLRWVATLLSSSEFASFSRTATLIALAVFMFMDVYKLFVSRHLPQGPVLPTRDELIGQAILLSSLYGPGKVGETIQKWAPGAVPSDMPTVDVSVVQNDKMEVKQ